MEAPVSSVEDRNGGEVEKSIYGLAIKKQTCPEPSRGISRLRFAALEMTRISALIIHNQYYSQLVKKNS